MVNNLLLLGRVGVKPEIKYSKMGVGYSDLRIAVNSKRKLGNDYIDHTDWFTVKLFGKTAENCVKYLDKGRMVFVEAKLSTGDFVDKEGKKQYSLDIIASRVEFIGGDPSKAIESGAIGTTATQPWEAQRITELTATQQWEAQRVVEPAATQQRAVQQRAAQSVSRDDDFDDIPF